MTWNTKEIVELGRFALELQQSGATENYRGALYEIYGGSKVEIGATSRWSGKNSPPAVRNSSVQICLDALATRRGVEDQAALCGLAAHASARAAGKTTAKERVEIAEKSQNEFYELYSDAYEENRILSRLLAWATGSTTSHAPRAKTLAKRLAQGSDRQLCAVGKEICGQTWRYDKLLAFLKKWLEERNL